MVPWLEYVRMYRIKKGDHWASDRAVVEWLSKYMKTEEMTALFKSLEKNPKVMDMVENLQAALIKKG
ncbi:hypothetical protein P3T76_002198 [Phytophthora citrophthora]|uniref:RXLR phytopathogen effector protein WY-domain domain-containing protein n=1 Tax=Phytophthora citrophthora TaxID=4793 RepID=A0AAD9GXZ7_9STRA|nr:hypothetical protein P3T76_002198 [Phytophthora citrophthora]